MGRILWTPPFERQVESRHELDVVYDAQLQVNEAADTDTQLEIARAALIEYRSLVQSYAETLVGKRVVVEADHGIMLYPVGDGSIAEPVHDVEIQGTLAALASLNLSRFHMLTPTVEAQLAIEFVDVSLLPVQAGNSTTSSEVTAYPFLSGIRSISL